MIVKSTSLFFQKPDDVETNRSIDIVTAAFFGLESFSPERQMLC